MKFETDKKGNSHTVADDDVQGLFEKLDQVEVPEPSDRMKQDFYLRLGEYKLQNSKPARFRFPSFDELFGGRSLALKPAFAIVLFLLGIIAGLVINNRNSKTEQLVAELQESQKTLMLTLLEQPSATTRLKAVNLTGEVGNPDSSVIDALFSTLDNDENANVRLAALEALFNYSKQPEVRLGLIKSIAHQDSPLILITLSKAMVALQEKGSVDEFRKLIDKGTLDEKAKSRINENIQKLI
jgi:hypothetical protein